MAAQADHLVLFKLKPEATEEQKQAALEALKGLNGAVPGIVDLTVGINFSDRGQGFEIGLFVRFTDRAALEAYGPHPAHQAVVRDFINPIKADVIVMDFQHS